MAASADYTAISATILPKRLLKADQFWRSARANQDYYYTPKCATLRGILAMQNARFERLKDRQRTPVLDIAWVEACNGTVNVTANVWVRGIPCDFSGWLVGTNKQEVFVKQRVDTSFSIPVEVTDSLFTPDELLQKGLAKAQKILAEKLDDIAVAKLISFSGINKYQGSNDLGVAGGAVGSEWKLTKLPWENAYVQSMSGYFQKVIDENDLSGARLFTGGALSLSEYVNNDNKDAFAFGDLSVYQDRRGFNLAAIPDDMFLVSNGSVALVTINNCPTEASTNFENITSVARPLLDLQDANGTPLYYDMYVKRVRRNVNADDHPGLTTTGRCEYMDNYYMEIHYEFLLNPTACSDTSTGVVRFRLDRTAAYVASPAQPVRTKAYA